jgi:hypothetical protein
MPLALGGSSGRSSQTQCAHHPYWLRKSYLFILMLFPIAFVITDVLACPTSITGFEVLWVWVEGPLVEIARCALRGQCRGVVLLTQTYVWYDLLPK